MLYHKALSAIMEDFIDTCNAVGNIAPVISSIPET